MWQSTVRSGAANRDSDKHGFPAKRMSLQTGDSHVPTHSHRLIRCCRRAAAATPPPSLGAGRRQRRQHWWGTSRRRTWTGTRHLCYAPRSHRGPTRSGTSGLCTGAQGAGPCGSGGGTGGGPGRCGQPSPAPPTRSCYRAYLCRALALGPRRGHCCSTQYTNSGVGKNYSSVHRVAACIHPTKQVKR